jgi:CubicO group peptidase (beta-lactamase class C family)
MAWHVISKDRPELLWHNGGTGGYRSFLGFVPAGKKGTIVLSNTVTNADELGLQILGEPQPVQHHHRKR